MQKNKGISMASMAIVIATITMILMKWLFFPELSYWIVFTPILALIGGLIVVLIISIIIGSIAYIFKKDKIGERKQKLKDLKE
jgi:amino acid transporter